MARLEKYSTAIVICNFKPLRIGVIYRKYVKSIPPVVDHGYDALPYVLLLAPVTKLTLPLVDTVIRAGAYI